MSLQSRQAIRLIKFVAELKKNNYPNVTSFERLLRRADVDENMVCACSKRTIIRDIETLIYDYGAPIVYDAQHRGYKLTDRSWTFNAPVMAGDVLAMTLIGARLTENMLPQPVRAKMTSTVEQSLAQNATDFFDRTTIESLLCATSIKASVDADRFKILFDAWRTQHVVSLIYMKPNAAPEPKAFEPHILAFSKGIWYVKGFEYKTKNVKSFAVQRIADVTMDPKRFKLDKKLVEETNANGLFEYPKIEGVKLKCDAAIAFYLYEHQKAKGFTIEPQNDGSLIVTLKPAFEHDLIHWILGEAGQIEVLEPVALRRKIAAAGARIAERNA